jgi:hypothetical protein
MPPSILRILVGGRILALPRSAGFQACCIAGFETCATFAYHGRVRCDLSPWAARPCRAIDKGAAQAATRQGVFAWLRPPSGALFTCGRGEPSAGLETCATAGLEACAAGAVSKCTPGRVGSSGFQACRITACPKPVEGVSKPAERSRCTQPRLASRARAGPHLRRNGCPVVV